MKFKSRDAAASKPGTVETLIGPGTELAGDLSFSGGLHLEGRIKGNVSAQPGTDAHLSVGGAAFIEGHVQVSSLILNGTVIGDVRCSGKMSLGAKAKVVGNVYYKVLEMQAGAQINGQMLHESRVPLVVLPPAEAPALVEMAAGSTINGGHVEAYRQPAESMN